MSYTYYIYHIPGEKIGCTTDLVKRMKDQGFTNFEIIWQEEGDYEFGWIAGEKEIELQKQYNLPVDKANYQISRINRFRNMELGQWNKETGNLSNIAKNINKDLDHQSNAGKKGGPITQSYIRTCPYCNTSIKGSSYFRWHGDNCKHKKSL
jgi:hypothetical protein